MPCSSSANEDAKMVNPWCIDLPVLIDGEFAVAFGCLDVLPEADA
jgi:hypothetical protein